MIDLVSRFGFALWDTLREMSPYLLFGFFMAGLLSVFVKPQFVERQLGGKGTLQVVKAAVFGVPLPLCSCGVIPVAASLRRHGASSAATTSFLISTPQTGVDSIMATLSLLGPVFAIFRPVAAFLSGLLGGVLVGAFGDKKGEAEAPRPVCTAECCSGEKSGKNPLWRALEYGFVTLPRDLAKALIVGIAIAAAISAIVPGNYLSAVLGGGIVSMLVMMAVGIPIYVCATASVPIAAALVAKGASPGAALVFLMTGPATNAATVTTVWKTMGKRVAAIYLVTVAFSAAVFGLLLDSLFDERGEALVSHAHSMIPGWLASAAAIALVIVLVAAMFKPSRVGDAPEKPAGAERLLLSIEGMSCSHCAEAVLRALESSPGVLSASVDLKSGRAIVAGSGIDEKSVSEAIEALGYRVSSIES